MPTATSSVPLLQMLYHAADIVRPLLGIVADNRRVERELIGLIVVIGGNHPHRTIVARRTADHRLVVDGAGQHKTVVVIGMLADQVDAAWRLNDMAGRITEGVSKQGLGFLFQTHHYTPDSRKWTSLTARSRSAACSAVRSRWVSASIS